jgi:lipopolysaccharide/colanic/teichoic acid biosynthesis glycosyltransferase
MLIISLFIAIDSRGGVFFLQKRVGRGGKDFKLIKFRTMITDSDKKGLLTVGKKDNRITKVGSFLRKYKLDELPQLFNVLLGEMSFVGPRPEVRKYVEKYTSEQRKILDIKPGITDVASIEYFDENELLSKADEPEKYYIDTIMPHKIHLNMKYRDNKTLGNYFKIIIKTFWKIFNH